MAPCMGPESRSCTFPLGRSVSRKAGKQIGKLNIYIYCCIELFSSDISVIKILMCGNCGIIQPYGMRFFILLTDCFRLN